MAFSASVYFILGIFKGLAISTFILNQLIIQNSYNQIAALLINEFVAYINLCLNYVPTSQNQWERNPKNSETMDLVKRFGIWFVVLGTITYSILFLLGISVGLNKYILLYLLPTINLLHSKDGSSNILNRKLREQLFELIYYGWLHT